MKLLFLLLILIFCNSFQSKTIAYFYGLGDSCESYNTYYFMDKIEMLTNRRVICVDYGESIKASFQTQCEEACNFIRFHKDLHGSMDFIGISQGGLIARYVIELCDNIGEKVEAYIALGTPQMGISKLPDLKILPEYGSFSFNILNGLARGLAPLKLSQYFIGPAGYFRNHSSPRAYEKGSFLAIINNENRSKYNPKIKERMLGLKVVYLAYFLKDNMIYPKESPMFCQFDEEGNFVFFRDTRLYKEDLIGLKELDESNRLIIRSFDSDHKIPIECQKEVIELLRNIK